MFPGRHDARSVVRTGAADGVRPRQPCPRDAVQDRSDYGGDPLGARTAGTYGTSQADPFDEAGAYRESGGFREAGSFGESVVSALVFTIVAFKASLTFGVVTLLFGDPLFILIVLAIYRIILEFFVVG
jgi:hypothetical protein